MRFHLVDVFAERRYAGNQLAVVESEGRLTDEEMQRVAAEMNYSETTFVESRTPGEDGYDVRIFTPNAELPFAGHPTLGTAAVLREAVDAGDEFALSLGAGPTPVRVERDGRETFWMTQRSPTVGERFDHGTLADLLSLDATDLDDEWPVEIVSTGLPTLVVPLADRAALERCDVDRSAYEALLGDRETKNVLAFCADPRDETNDLAVRVFAPGIGVAEDPATGSSNGCLVGYLSAHEFFGSSEVACRVEQGYEMGRPSLLHLRADSSGTVEVGGAVVRVGCGDLVVESG